MVQHGSTPVNNKTAENSQNQWKQKKEKAERYLDRLWGVWHHKPVKFGDSLPIVGPLTNQAILDLRLETHLPLPYDEEVMMPPLLGALAANPQNTIDDDISKRILAWKKFLKVASPEQRLEWQGKAIALLTEHRDWTVDKVAKEVGKTRQAIYKDRLTGVAVKARNHQKRR